MGKSVSKESDVSSSGVVNSNVVVDEQGATSIPLDLRILFYAIGACILLVTALKIRNSYRRSLKRDLNRSIYLRAPQPDNN